MDGTASAGNIVVAPLVGARLSLEGQLEDTIPCILWLALNLWICYISSMNIRIRYFASLREIVGQNEETLTLHDGATVTDVRALLLTRYPRLQPIMERSLCAVNRSYVPGETILRDGDELVFIPPMGGGCQESLLWSH